MKLHVREIVNGGMYDCMIDSLCFKVILWLWHHSLARIFSFCGWGKKWLL